MKNLPPEPPGRGRHPWLTYPSKYGRQVGDSTEHEVSRLIAALVDALKPHFCVEVGTNDGRTSGAIGHVLHRNNHGMLLTIERDPDFARAATDRFAGRLPIIVRCSDSKDVDLQREGIRWIDFLFIDGGAETRVRDAEQFGPLVRVGGCMVIHDSHFFPETVAWVKKQREWRYVELGTLRGLIIAIREGGEHGNPDV